MKTWIADCPRCNDRFEYKEPSDKQPCTDENGKSIGMFCPTCRAKKTGISGVLHFYEDPATKSDATVYSCRDAKGKPYMHIRYNGQWRDVYPDPPGRQMTGILSGSKS